MKIKRTSLYCMEAVFTMSLLAYVYLQAYAMPRFTGASDAATVLADSMLYRELALLEFSEIVGSWLRLLVVNQLGITSVGYTIRQLGGAASDYLAPVLNLALLSLTLRNFQRVFRADPQRYGLFILCLLVNPLIITSLVALNKEIFGLFFVSSYLANGTERKHWRMAAMVVMGFLIRNVYGFSGTLFGVMSWLKVPRFCYLLTLAAVAPFTVPSDYLILLLQEQKETSVGFTVLLSTIQEYPFGYLLTYVPKLLLNAFEGIVRAREAIPAGDFYETFVRISSWLFLVGAIGVTGRIMAKKRIPLGPENMFLAYTFLICINAFVQHRYLLPLYPVLLCLLLMRVPRRDEGPGAGGSPRNGPVRGWADIADWRDVGVIFEHGAPSTGARMNGAR